MRLNKYIAAGTDLSRRKADDAIAAGRVTVNGQPATAGQDVADTDVVALDNQRITPAVKPLTLMLNKPRGYVVSRDGQGAKTVYDLLPPGPEYQRLNPVGRLDKDSSGLLLLTNDGTLAHELTHPSRQKIKIYQITLDKPLQPLHRQMITDHGIMLEDGRSQLQLDRPDNAIWPTAGNAAVDTAASTDGGNHSTVNNGHNGAGNDTAWQVTMHEGRNRQIRRTFAALGYTVQTLHRTQFGPYTLGSLPAGQYHLAA